MRDREYRRDQHGRRYEDHVAPINQLVDQLREERGEWMPYVAPIYGGVDARVLALFRDPGPKTRDERGSGMLSLENDDQSAERHLSLVQRSGMLVDELVVWNTYPWYINRKPTTREIDEGLAPLQRLFSLLPNLAVVIAHGGEAQTAFRRFTRIHAGAVRGVGEVINTYHTSRQALWTPDPAERTRREGKLVADYARAVAFLNGFDVDR
ncbi:uracil-DNA glycosylase [Nocardia xishanensis]|uniref:uracil-DNA glycosylase n=1 Tax=Nocardia xishanensis TaxID=238964 RepID=UPI0034259B13